MNLLNSAHGPLGPFGGGNRSYHAVMRLLLILLWAACFCLSLSQTTPGGGGGGGGGGTNLNPAEGDYDGYTELPTGETINGEPFAWIKVIVSTPGVDSVEDYISGTNTAVSCQAEVVPNAAWPGTQTVIEGYTLMNVQITVGGQSIVNQSWDLNGVCNEGYLNRPPNFTFASTHFDHGLECEIKLQGQFQAYTLENGVRIPTGPLMTHYARLKPTVHNKVVGWRTHIKFDPDNPSGPGIPWPEPDNTYISDVVNTLKALYSAAKYDVSLVDLGVLQRNTILDRYKEITGVIANTHGSTNGLYDSDGLVLYGDRLNWNDQTAKINYYGMRGLDNELPKTHLHFAYACSAANSETYALNALQTMATGGALCGFEDPIWSQCLVPGTVNGVSNELHAAVIRDWLLNGHSIEDAVDEANRLYITGWPEDDDESPEGFIWRPRPMAVRGDGCDTAKWVYLPRYERDMLAGAPYADWKKVRWAP